MDISIIVTTHNGERTLPTMLDSLCRMGTLGITWQLIAVDNASTDSTWKILSSYKDILPLILLQDSVLGKNHAINSALSYAEGDIIVFTDDDVIVSQDWLIQWKLCFKVNPDYSIFGGYIKAYCLAPCPKWIQASMPIGCCFAITREDLKEGEVHGNFVWGNNMALRRSIIDLGYKFNPVIGPKGKNYIMGGEAEFIDQLSKVGYKSWYCKSIVVHHIIRPYQFKLSWLLGRAFRAGRSVRVVYFSYLWRHITSLDRYIVYIFLWEMSFALGYVMEKYVYKSK